MSEGRVFFQTEQIGMTQKAATSIAHDIIEQSYWSPYHLSQCFSGFYLNSIGLHSLVRPLQTKQTETKHGHSWPHADTGSPWQLS